MKLFCAILLICLSVLSCKQQSTNEQKAFAQLDWIFSNYCLEDHSKQFKGPNLIIFSKQGRWVPSYYLVLRKKENDVDVIYQEVDKVNEVINPEMLFFQGIAFRIDSSRWSEVAYRSEALLEKRGENSYEEGVVDGVDYILSYNRQACVVNLDADAEHFEEFSKYLNDSIITPVKNLRRTLPSE